MLMATLLPLGVFAGIWLGRFTASLTPKEFKEFAIQWDLGNTVVGIATGILAFVTLYLSRQNQKQASGHKHAEFIVRWIEELRIDTAKYVKLHQNIMLSRRSSPSQKVPVRDRDKILELSETRARLKMMIRLDTDDKEEKKFLNLISKDVEEDEDKSKQQRIDIVNSSREVQKNAWQLAKRNITNSNLQEI